MIIQGDALTELRKLQSGLVHCCVTSPPYWGLRDYGIEGQLGLEKTLEEYTEKLVTVFREVRRVLRDDGTLWLNLGDSYAGSWSGNSVRPEGGAQREGTPGFQSKYAADNQYAKRSGAIPTGLKAKDLIGVPWRIAFALQADGWYLRQDIIWSKPNPMPESVKDRCTKSHEYIFLLTKAPKYYFDHEAIKEPTVCAHEAKYDNGEHGHKGGLSHEGQGSSTRKFGSDPNKKNKRSVWNVITRGFKDCHFATFPPDLIEPCILAGCPESGTILDPFFGAGTAGVVALKHSRKYIGIELKPEYVELAQKRIKAEHPLPSAFW